MAFSDADTAFFALIIPVAIYIGAAILSLVIFYWLIKRAIRTAMADHYKTVRHYEQTGQWRIGPFRPGEPPLDSEQRR